MIELIVLRLVRLPLREDFVTSYGHLKERQHIIVELRSNGISAWGECPLQAFPGYSPETLESAWHLISTVVIPLLRQRAPTQVLELSNLLRPIVGNHFAKAAVEMAFWDLLSKMENAPLWRMLGGTRREILSGIVLGVEPNFADLCRRIESAIEINYKRIKFKIRPGHDLEYLREIRREFPQLKMAVDANAAYNRTQIPLLQELDQFNLEFVEQPFASTDLLSHAKLQSQTRTIICLDESVHDIYSLESALELGACKMLNLKAGRVGGLSAALQIHDLCRKLDLGLWVGGMLESGIGKAFNMALASLPGCTAAADISETRRYGDIDLLSSEICLNSQGNFELPEQSGIGFAVDLSILERMTIKQAEFAIT